MLNERYEGDIYRAVVSPLELIERSDSDPVMGGMFSRFDSWYEVNSPIEGQFMERITRGAFAKSINENMSKIRVVFNHGLDRSLGGSVLGKLERMSEESDGAHYEATLFRSVPQLLIDGLRAGVYGASFRGDAIKRNIDYTPKKSDYNPEGLPEVTLSEIRLKDVGPTERPVVADTTSFVRCITDELALGNLLGSPETIRALFDQGAATLERREEPEPEATTPTADEPTHSATGKSTSKEEVPSWHLSR